MKEKKEIKIERTFISFYFLVCQHCRAKQSTTMQASLCHRTTSLNVKNHHFQHPVHEAMYRDCQLALNFSPLFGNGLRAGPSRTIIKPAIRAHLNPPDNGINKSKEEYERCGIAKSTVAAVVYVCTLGAMCTFLATRAQWWPLPTTERATETRQEKSIQALLEILEGKPAPTPTTLLDILQQELPKDALEKVRFFPLFRSLHGTNYK